MFLLEALTDQAFTRWLDQQQSVWHWQDQARWEATGGGYPELATLEYQPHFQSEPLHRPFSAGCYVLTGHGGDGSPTMEIGFDVSICLLELNEDRQPSRIRHGSTAPPAPAALSLEELSDVFLAALSVVSFASAVRTRLLRSNAHSGLIGSWLQVRGGELAQLVDVSHLRRLRGGPITAHAFEGARWWPRFGSDAREKESRAIVSRLLAELLERSGYRGAVDTPGDPTP